MQICFKLNKKIKYIFGEVHQYQHSSEQHCIDISRASPPPHPQSMMTPREKRKKVPLWRQLWSPEKESLIGGENSRNVLRGEKGANRLFSSSAASRHHHFYLLFSSFLCHLNSSPLPGLSLHFPQRDLSQFVLTTAAEKIGERKKGEWNSTVLVPEQAKVLYFYQSCCLSHARKS